MSKPILCVDFDGVIHAYTTPWEGAAVISDPPVPGAMEFLLRAAEHFTVAVYSSRSKDPAGISAMRVWLVAHLTGLLPNSGERQRFVYGELQFPNQKPPAFLTIDDRAICFDGDWSKIEPADLLQFKPWNKRGV